MAMFINRVLDSGRAIRNYWRMDKDERARRMMIAFVSRDIYDAGKLLESLAARIGGEYEEEVKAYITKNEILVVEKVWELEEANRLRDEVTQYIERARVRIEEEEKCLIPS
jgi:hypothetical protein